MNVLKERTPNSPAIRGISSICASRMMIAWKTMSTRLAAATAFCIAGSASAYEPRVITNGSSVVTPPDGVAALARAVALERLGRGAQVQMRVEQTGQHVAPVGVQRAPGVDRLA